MDALTFTEEELAGEINRFAELDGRVMPRIGVGGVKAKTGKCSRCGKWSGPYSLCRRHRELGSIKRVMEKLVDDGFAERMTDGRGKKGGALYRKKPSVPIVRAEAKIGRNDPCPCGSGRKYKRCCGSMPNVKLTGSL